MNEETKICPLCAEPIKAAAKICPHCRHWQTRWSIHHPTIQATIAVAPLLLTFLGFSYYLEHMLWRGEDFAAHRGELKVLDSSFHFGEGKEGPIVFVVGTITNTGSLSWKDVEIEARFFDANGNLINVAKRTVPTDTVVSTNETAFRVETRAFHSKTNYASHSVAITSAKDTQARF